MHIRKFLYRLLVAVLTATMLISGTVVARYIIDAVRQKQEYSHLTAQVDSGRAQAPAQTESQSPERIAEAPAEPSILPEYAALYEENSDLVGWMTIDGTPIHYPVMQSPDRADFYLDHNFQRQKNSHGCLYVRESCDVFVPSDNLTIYGHHMRNGSMFAALDKFRSKDFYAQHPAIRFDTLYERHTYTVFAVFTTVASVDKGFAYHLFEDAADEAEFQDFVSTCKSLSLYETGITPVYGDKLICLSTCEYSNANGRLVVAAVRD